MKSNKKKEKFIDDGHTIYDMNVDAKWNTRKLPVCEKLSKTVISIPMHPYLETEAQNYAKGLVEALDVSTSTGEGTFVSSVTQNDGKITVTKSKMTLSHITDLTYASSTSAGTAIAQKSYVDSTVSSAIDNANISGKITSAINGLDSSVSATAESSNQVSVLTGVTQTDGKLANKTEVKLAAIAKTGNVNDLIQTSGDVLIFDCGGAGV